MSQSNKNKSLEMQQTFGGQIISEEFISSETPAGAFKTLPYHTRLNPPQKKGQTFKKHTKVQTSPFMAKSPQDVLKQHGVYKDDSIYKVNPSKVFMDLTQYDDYQTLLNKQNSAKRHFESLDVDIRAKFNHDPVKFAAYLASPDFDVKEILTADEFSALKTYQRDEVERIKREEYFNSEEYKQSQKDDIEYQEFQKEQFNNWKKNRKS